MRITILGSGNWGCGLTHLFSKRHDVTLWGRNPEKIQDLRLSNKFQAQAQINEIHFTSDINSAILDADLIIESVSVNGVREVLQKIKKSNLVIPILLTSKGLEKNTNHFLSQIASENLNNSDSKIISVFTGPTLVKEIIAEKLACAVIACKNLDQAVFLSKELSTKNLKLFATTDIIGVQFGGVFKNLLAILSGFSDGLELGSNTKAFVLTRSVQEIRHVGLALGCMPQTIYGLSGLGDMLATCFSKESRNYKLGWYIAKNKSVLEAQKLIGQTVEGIETCESLLNLAKKHCLNVPISQSIFSVLKGKNSAIDAINTIIQTQDVLEWA